MQRPKNGVHTANYIVLQKGYDVVPTVSLIFPIQIYNYIFSYTTIFIVFF